MLSLLPLVLSSLTFTGDFDALETEWNAALRTNAAAWLERWRADPSAPLTNAAPVQDYWDRFEAFAEGGEPRAVVWLLRYVDQSGGEEPELRARTTGLFERIRGVDAAAWLREAIPPLVRSRERLGEGAVIAQLERWSEAGVPELRRAARLELAGLLGATEADRARELRLSAFVESGEEPPALDDLAERVENELDDAGSEHFERWFLDLGDMYIQKPGAPPDPEVLYRPVLEILAERGSTRACLWCLDSIWPEDDAERARLRRYLELVADADLAEDQLRTLAWGVSQLVYSVGADPTEAAVLEIAERADEETRARLLAGLGEGLCADPVARERGLALLREVVERWPDSEAASGARGKLFRFENLVVGKPAPDFGARDVDGNAFKLSDYEGKVTVVDFWGFW